MVLGWKLKLREPGKGLKHRRITFSSCGRDDLFELGASLRIKRSMLLKMTLVIKMNMKVSQGGFFPEASSGSPFPSSGPRQSPRGDARFCPLKCIMVCDWSSISRTNSPFGGTAPTVIFIPVIPLSEQTRASVWFVPRWVCNLCEVEPWQSRLSFCISRTDFSNWSPVQLRLAQMMHSHWTEEKSFSRSGDHL